jgi:hypothetical protein
MAGPHSPSHINEHVKNLRSQNTALAEFGSRALLTHNLEKCSAKR